LKLWARLAAVALMALTAPAYALAHGEHAWGAQDQHREAEHERPAYPPQSGRDENGAYYQRNYGGRSQQPAYPPPRQPYYAPGAGYPAYQGYRPPTYGPQGYGGQGYRGQTYAPQAYRGQPYGGQAYAPRASYGRWLRGQIMPPGYRGDVINDFGRYHLRRPPRGYYWVREGDDFVLVAIGTGLIFEVIPGGY
jgi:Ni/Co efflux regulator RcnB